MKKIYLLTEKDSLLRALKVGLIVGIVLNIINNPQLFESHSSTPIHLNRVLLTFLVPFCVSLYSSVMANKNRK